MRQVIIMGAAGRDFHDFNVFFRDDPDTRVVCFTAAQIPDIAGRRYPPGLAGAAYPDGIPIEHESELARLVKEHGVDVVVLAYSDISHQHVMDRASEAMAAGASFMLLGPGDTMIGSSKPVISVTAVRTGAGKSQTTRRVVEIVRGMGLRPVVVRHPMPYGDLEKQAVQRFASIEDLETHGCTIEEREEYEPHLARGTVVYAGVDYGRILEQAEEEADVVIWDGGNNDFSFFVPDLSIVVTDPHRAGHELAYYPGAVNLRMADVVVINKIDTATRDRVDLLRDNIRRHNPAAVVVEAASPISVDDPGVIEGKRVLVIEDGPTLTHGEMAYGAGVIAARKFGARELIDPRPFAAGSLRDVFARYPHLDRVLPAMGYGSGQIRDLEETVRRSGCEGLVIATPVDLARLIEVSIPSTRVHYELEEVEGASLTGILCDRLDRLRKRV